RAPHGRSDVRLWHGEPAPGRRGASRRHRLHDTPRRYRVSLRSEARRDTGAVNRATRLSLFAAAALSVGAVAGARRVGTSRAHEAIPAKEVAGLELHVPHAAGPIVLDGDMDDVGWVKATARTNAFVDGAGAPAHPYSDARLVWGDGHLYVALYAA